MRDVDLPTALEDARARRDGALFAHRAAVDECSRIAGDEHENLGRIAEAVVPDRDPIDHIERNVVEERASRQNPPKLILCRPKRTLRALSLSNGKWF